MTVEDSSKQRALVPREHESVPGIPAREMAFLGRLTVAILLGFLFVASFAALLSVYGHKFFDVTGQAKWIWPRMDISRGNPVAFFATRDFDLPSSRYYTKIKVAGDPEYRLYFNGHEIAGRRAGAKQTLDVYDVTGLARDSRNRIVVTVRATRGVGGLIVTVDLGPDFENYVVSDGSWRISKTWSAGLIDHDAGTMQQPMVLGAPPFGRWNYLQPRDAAAFVPPTGVKEPVATFGYLASVGQVKVVGGVAIMTSQQLHATAFDFSDTDGVLRLTRNRGIGLPELVNVRLANGKTELTALEGEIRSYAFAAGERSVVDTETRHFRYVGVYGDAATVDALVNK